MAEFPGRDGYERNVPVGTTVLIKTTGNTWTRAKDGWFSSRGTYARFDSDNELHAQGSWGFEELAAGRVPMTPLEQAVLFEIRSPVEATSE